MAPQTNVPQTNAPTATVAATAAGALLYRQRWDDWQALLQEAARCRQPGDDLIKEGRAAQATLHRTRGKKARDAALATLEKLEAAWAAVLAAAQPHEEAAAASAKLLDELAPGALLVPLDGQPITVLRTVHPGSYSTQTQPHHYARGNLMPQYDSLRRLGFAAEIVCGPLPGVDPASDAYASDVYSLHSNAAPWQFDCLGRRQLLSDTLASWRAWGCNVRVFCPFLPWGTEERLGLM